LDKLVTGVPTCALPIWPGLPNVRQDTRSVAASFRERAGSDAVATRTAADVLPEGAIAIAAITSCTNTSNPHGMVRAGLLARTARSEERRVGKACGYRGW